MSKIVSMLGCLSVNGDPNQNPQIRVCHMPHKLQDETAQLDLSDCKLELSGLDTTDFKMCPFCISSLYKAPATAQAPLDPKVYQTRTSSGELIPITYMPNKVGSKTMWFVGQVVSSTDVASKNFDMISPQTLQIQRQLTIDALKSSKVYDESSFGLYIISVD